MLLASGPELYKRVWAVQSVFVVVTVVRRRHRHRLRLSLNLRLSEASLQHPEKLLQQREWETAYNDRHSARLLRQKQSSVFVSQMLPQRKQTTKSSLSLMWSMLA